ncbi:hypothetical protein MauCBS54593_000546 [Microsporum audouinii]
MPSHIECSRPQRPLKRPLKHSLDKSDSECPHLSKRQQPIPTPPTPGHSLDKTTRPSSHQTVSSTRTEASCPSKKYAPKDVNPASNHKAKKRRIDDWFAGLLPIRASSCPPRLLPSDPPSLSPGEGQRPLLEVLQEMSEPQTQRLGRGSAGSARSSRLPTSHPDYRSILRNNGVYIDHTGAKIPQELRCFLDSDILKERSASLSPQAIAEALNTAVEIADSPEGNIYDLASTALLPIKHSDVGRGSNTPWYTDGLPRKDAFDTPLAQPKPDVHCGYLTGQRSTWTVEENAVIDHQQARRITQPAIGNCFPFFVFEMKSEAMGGTIWQAENQAAGSGACCVSAMRWLFREAYASEDQSVVDSIAFSACVTHREVVLHVHHYSVVEDRYYMSSIGTFQTMRDVQACNNIVKNIFEHGLGTRQRKTRDALKQLYPFPKHWRKTRSARVMESGVLGADNEEVASNKIKRTEYES